MYFHCNCHEEGPKNSGGVLPLVKVREHWKLLGDSCVVKKSDHVAVHDNYLVIIHDVRSDWSPNNFATSTKAWQN